MSPPAGQGAQAERPSNQGDIPERNRSGLAIQAKNDATLRVILNWEANIARGGDFVLNNVELFEKVTFT